MRRVVLSCVLCLSTLAGLFPLFAADEPAKKPGAKGAAKDVKDIKADPSEWKTLIARRKQLIKEIEGLEKEFRGATDQNSRQKVFTKYEALEAEFRGELQPKILKLAPQIYEKSPADIDAAEVIAAKAFQENHYKDVMQIADKVQKGGGKLSAPLLTFLGISQFATHDFEHAQATLKAAEKEDKQLFPQLGLPFLQACGHYIKFWEAEQSIRAKEQAADDLPRVLFKTNKGDIVIELFENEAPNTVANFISLVEAGKYDGTKFHRVIPNFMAQGGDPNTLDDDPNNDGQGGPGYTIACECYTEKARKHFQGSLSMAHAGRNTGGSQFFLTHLPTTHLNYAEGKEDGNHTVFGRVIKGLDIALSLERDDEIETASVIRKREHEYVPKKQAERRPGRKPAKPPVEE